jgi:hypothetical protein
MNDLGVVAKCLGAALQPLLHLGIQTVIAHPKTIFIEGKEHVAK